MKNIAVYWDFENIHVSLCKRERGEIWCRENFYRKQPCFVDISSIMQYIAELGDVNINRAYANWLSLQAYRNELHNHAIDLIQLFPTNRSGKNGADIRMSIDIMEDMAVHKHIDTIVLLGGDSDYIAVAQKVRQQGKTIVGVGVQETTSEFWLKSCNEFKFYSSLLVKSTKIKNLEAEGYEVQDIDSAKGLLKKAVRSGSSRNGADYILKATLKPLMQRFDPSFDESNYGYDSFVAFLNDCKDVINITQGANDHEIRLKTVTHDVSRRNGDEAVTDPYKTILRQQDIKLIDHKLLGLALESAFSMLYQKEINMLEFKEKLVTSVVDDRFTEADAAKVKKLLHKSMSFQYLGQNRTTLTRNIDSVGSLKHKVHATLAKRVLDNIVDEEIDVPLMAENIYGDRRRVDDVHLLMSEYNNMSS